MAVVALTDAEKITLRSDTVLSNNFAEKVMDKAAYFMGITSGDLTWAKSRHWSAVIQNNPNTLFGDTELIDILLFNMAIREFDNKDDAGSGLTAQVLLYLNASSRFDFLVDDYFAVKTKQMLF